MNTNIGMIWAQCKNSQYKSLQPSYMRALIGNSKYPLWSLYDDMRFFLRVTRHSVIIMGRKTWDSIASKDKMLAHRYVIVVTHDNSLLCRRSSVKILLDNEQRLFFLPSAQKALSMAQELVKIIYHRTCDELLANHDTYRTKTYKNNKNNSNRYYSAHLTVRESSEHIFDINSRLSFINSVLSRTFKSLSLVEAIGRIPSIWICGGEDMYNYFLPYAHILLVTHIDKETQGDIYAPSISLNEFHIKGISPWKYSHSEDCQRYRFLAFQRQNLK